MAGGMQLLCALSKPAAEGSRQCSMACDGRHRTFELCRTLRPAPVASGGVQDLCARIDSLKSIILSIILDNKILSRRRRGRLDFHAGGRHWTPSAQELNERPPSSGGGLRIACSRLAGFAPKQGWFDSLQCYYIVRPSREE